VTYLRLNGKDNITAPQVKGVKREYEGKDIDVDIDVGNFFWNIFGSLNNLYKKILTSFLSQ